MFTQLKILDWVIEVDRKTTVQAYKKLQSGAQECGCQGCQNFIRIREKFFSKEFLDMLNQLGIDYKKDVEVYDIEDTSCKKRIFSGWYHACGRILQGWKTPEPKLGEVQELKYIPFDNNCKILIREAHALASKDFPHPILQLEFTFEIAEKGQYGKY